MTTPLFDRYTPRSFGGETFDDELDGERLTRLLDRVRHVMSDGQWRTIPEVQRLTGGSENGVASRIRDLRKPKYGGFNVPCRRRKGQEKAGVWEYRLDLTA